ncbi:MAG: methyltransferase domain-containing protein [Armatimonas sp.]
MNPGTTESFYDELTPYYHLIFENWEASMTRQAAALDAIVQQTWGAGQGRTVLDAACGIGTQAIGLARLGYRVTGSDISARELERAKEEATAHGVELELAVADMRALPTTFPGRQFDIVLACDNALPHLLTHDDLLQAFQSFYGCTRPGGGCLISVRDYETEPKEGTHIKPVGVRQEGDTRHVVFQVWEFTSPSIYDLSLYLTTDKGGECTTRVLRSEYYAVSIPKLMALMEQAGFEEVTRIDGAFYQPILVGKKR